MPPTPHPPGPRGASHPADLVFDDTSALITPENPPPVRTVFEEGPGKVQIHTGSRWSSGDGARLLAALSAARRRRRPLEVFEHGIRISGVLAAAMAESPHLRVRVRAAAPRGGPTVHRRAPHPAVPRGPVDAGTWVQVPDLRWRPLRQDMVVITGGLGGIGLRLAAEFAALGHPVALVDRTSERDLGPQSRQVLERVRSTSPTTVIHADLDRADPAEVVRRLPAPVGYLVHAAGNLVLDRFERTSGSALDRAANGHSGQLVRLVETLGRGPLDAVLVLGSSESRSSHRGFGPYGLSHACTRAAVGELAARYPRTRFTVAESTLWSEVGMAAATAGPHLRAAGFATVSPAWGARAVVRLISRSVFESERATARVYALGGTRLATRFDALAVIGGVGGAAVLSSRDTGTAVSRLVKGCLPQAGPGDVEPPRFRSRGSRILRALVCPEGLRLWSSCPEDWLPNGEYEALVPF